jgi:hypothetical protein
MECNPPGQMTTTKMKETISLLMSGVSKLLICRSHAELQKICIRLDLLQVCNEGYLEAVVARSLEMLRMGSGCVSEV